MVAASARPIARSINRGAAVALSVADDSAAVATSGAPVLLPVGLVRADGGTQMRAAINPDTVAEYAEIMRAANGWGKFPPAKVRYDGSVYWLADGFHRRAAWLQVGGDLAEMPCIIVPGTRRDAILDAAGANADHGLRRTNEDKRRAVAALLSDPEWAEMGSGWIAERCNVSDRFVRTVRAEMAQGGSDGLSRNGSGIAETTRTVKRGDSVYTMRVQTGQKPPTSGRVHYTREDVDPIPADDLPIREYDPDLPDDLPAVVPSEATHTRQTLPALGKCAVCGRPLSDPAHAAAGCGPVCSAKRAALGAADGADPVSVAPADADALAAWAGRVHLATAARLAEIGRASCRERV